LQKTRYNVSPYYYAITNISGKSTTITTPDGSAKTVIRSQVIHINSKIKEAKTIGSTSHDSVIEIL
jgi:hypothetical protein